MSGQVRTASYHIGGMSGKIDDLEAHAAKFWPTELAQREQGVD